MTPHQSDPLDHLLSEENIQRFLSSGILILPGALPLRMINLLIKDSRALCKDGSFYPAGIGQGSGRHLDHATRSDLIYWWDVHTPVVVRQRFWLFVEALRLRLNRCLYLGLFDSELHYAIYEPGDFYSKHRDQFRGNNQRKVSLVLFLNHDWLETDGGQLRLYADDETAFCDVQPMAGVLVLFSSERVLHEVLPTNRLRLTLTGWLGARRIQ